MAKRKKKKQSNNGVWIGMGISGAITSIIVIALAMSAGSDPADSQSGKITQASLALQVLDTSSLPVLGEGPTASGSLDELLSLINESAYLLRAGGYAEEKEAKAREIIEALHGAAASDFPANLLDSKIPPKRFESSELRNDLEALGKAISTRIDEHNEMDEFEGAQAIAVSYLKLGEQVFDKNKRLKPRQRGLAMMRAALSKLRRINQLRFESGDIDTDLRDKTFESIALWNEAIGDFEKVWNSKLKVIEAVKNVNTADIILVANEDEDISFRAFATLRLGYAYYERGDEANRAAITGAIESLKSDADPLVATAAKEADSIEREEYHELRK
ncbi:MAG: hypothetical protein AAF711_12300 [Planctomycetota bacterium]